MKTKRTAFLLSLVLVLTLCLPASASGSAFYKTRKYRASTFSDVSPDAWYAPYVKSAYEYGLMQGTSSSRFSPEDSISIAETIVLACELYSACAEDGHVFSSSSSPWYADYVDYAVASGIIGRTQFASYTAKATRADFVYILSSALPRSALQTIRAVSSIPDVSSLAPYYDAVTEMYGAGILAGTDQYGTFCPEDDITRASAAVILSKIVDESAREACSPVPRKAAAEEPFSLSTIAEFSEFPYTVVNGGTPYFTSGDYTTSAFETYSSLDALDRCGIAYANVCEEIMPTEKRGSISSVKPSGWHTVRYDDLISDRYLYNRCHLIAYELAGENANRQNLITGTRYMNVSGMLPFENEVHDYVKETGNHVLYRVTPVFEGSNLVADGVLMEAYSVEDRGAGICFNVFCYNVQPGVAIDYATGNSEAVENYYLADS